MNRQDAPEAIISAQLLVKISYAAHLVVPWIRGSPTKKAKKGPSGRMQRGFSNDRTNQIITFHQWNLV